VFWKPAPTPPLPALPLVLPLLLLLLLLLWEASTPVRLPAALPPLLLPLLLPLVLPPGSSAGAEPPYEAAPAYLLLLVLLTCTGQGLLLPNVITRFMTSFAAGTIMLMTKQEAARLRLCGGKCRTQMLCERLSEMI